MRNIVIKNCIATFAIFIASACSNNSGKVISFGRLDGIPSYTGVAKVFACTDLANGIPSKVLTVIPERGEAAYVYIEYGESSELSVIEYRNGSIFDIDTNGGIGKRKMIADYVNAAKRNHPKMMTSNEIRKNEFSRVSHC